MVCLLFCQTSQAKIIIFMDNSGSIKKYHDLFESQIIKIFEMAKSKNVNITLIPIGNNYFQTVNENEVGDIFKFSDKTTYISNILQKADHIINKQKDTILFISDMEPDQKNTEGSWKLLADDYRDVLAYYKILYQWVQSGANIYFILLNHEAMAGGDYLLDKQKNIIDNLSKLIKLQQKKQDEFVKQKKIDPNGQYTQFIRDKKQNKELIQKILRSLPSDSLFYYPLPLEKQSIFYSIVEPIIDPSVVKELKVKIEIDELLVKNLSNVDFKKYLKKYLPKNVGRNPTRHLKHQITICKHKFASRKTINHDSKFHYHFHVLKKKFGNEAKIFQTYVQFVDGKRKIIHNDTTRDLKKFKYFYVKDICSRIEEQVNKIEAYHEKDIPIGEKEIVIAIKNKEKPSQKLVGYDLKIGENNSLPTDKNGICITKVRRQANVWVSLLYYASMASNYKDSSLKILNISKDIIANSEKGKPIEINIPQELFQDVTFILNDKIDSDVEVIISQDDTKIFKKIDTFTIKRSIQIPLLPSKYNYNVNYKKDKYLNKWFNKFNVFKEPRDVTINTQEDKFFDSKAAIIFINDVIDETKSWPGNGLTGTFKDHLLGSKNSLLRLFEHLNYNEQLNNDNPQKKDIILMKSFWKRIYYFLFEGQNSNLAETFLYHSFIKLGLIDQKSKEDIPVKGAKNYVQRMVENFTGIKSNTQFDETEKRYYNKTVKTKLELKHLDAIIHYFNFEK